ncbi:MAG: glycosyltransferase family 4 protein [Acidobacteria bacterium]|nr:glycosyltransferase family 4 protein [Acidobacteriota bacterium]
MPTGGIARYTAEIAAALAAEFPAEEYWLVSDQVWKGGPQAPNLHRGRRPGNWIARRWWTVGLAIELRRLGAAVFHGTDFGAPYLPVVPSVLTLHDLSPWQEGDRRAAAAERIRRRTPSLLRLATMILTPTEAIRREAIERFHMSPSRVAAVPLAAGPMFRPCPPAQTGAPYLLFVGTRERRKNLKRLIDAWREARRCQPDLELVLVGRPGEDSGGPQVLNLKGEPGLKVAGLLPDAEVAALMSGAALFVYPSLYEGFGLPVLEAMQAGAPVLISADPALREVAGDAAVAVDTDSTTALTRAIVELMRDSRWRGTLRERGLRRAAEFSWRRTAIETHDVYVEALRRF